MTIAAEPSPRSFHLTCNSLLYRAGWVNIDPYPRVGQQIRGCLHNLSDHVENGEALEIVAYRVLEHYSYFWVEPIIRGWVPKLAAGGELTIVGLDLMEVIADADGRGLTIPEINAELFGSADSPGSRRGSIATMEHITSILRGEGLQIVEQRREGRLYIVRGRLD